MSNFKTVVAVVAGLLTFLLVFFALRWATSTALAVANGTFLHGKISAQIISPVYQSCKILGVLVATFVAYRLGGRRLITVGFFLSVMLLYITRLLVARFESDWLRAADSKVRLSYVGDVFFFSILLVGAIYSVVKALRKPDAGNVIDSSKTVGHD